MDFQPIQTTNLQLPEFTMVHITNYFIERLTSDGKAAKDFKSVNKKAYPLFKDGHVQSIKACTDDQRCTYKSICLPEMKKNITYSITLTVNRINGDILSAVCGCPAGLGPTGSCKHIAALCYALEEFSRIRTTNDYTACTSKLQEWNQPRKRKLDAEIVGDIKFVKLEHGKVKREATRPWYDPRPPFLQRTTSQEISNFKKDLGSLKTPCAFLHVLPVDTPLPFPSTSLPPTPRSSREKVLVEMRTMEQPISLMQIAALGRNFLNRITPSSVACRNSIEAATTAQSDSKRWHEEHFGRLTASKLGEMIKCRVPTTKCMQLLYPSKSAVSSASLQWGRENEARAREHYIKHGIDSEFTIRESGIFISEIGFLGASPDGLVYKNSQLEGIIEIKCPYSARNRTIHDACSGSSFFCTKDSSDRIYLRKNHNYYYQVQGQLAILKVDWCDFVVWTLKDFKVERIHFDTESQRGSTVHCRAAVWQLY